MKKLSVAVLFALIAATGFFPELWGGVRQTVRISSPMEIVRDDNITVVVHGNDSRVEVVEEHSGFFGSWKKETVYLLPEGTKPSVLGLPEKTVIGWTK